METRGHLRFKAELAVQTERYQEMLVYLKKMIDDPVEFNQDERNLLLIAYKHLLNPKQFSWRVITTLEKDEGVTADELEMIRAHKRTIELEIEALCAEVLQLIEETIFPKLVSPEGKVFFHKMKGDYNRYLLEIQSEVRRDITRAKALESYSAAHAIALKDLKPADPVRLGVALNFSVFYHENLHSHDLACEIAKKAFDDAFVELNSTEDPWNPETTTIMQLIKENLTAWMGDELIVAEMQDAEDEELAAAQVGPGSRLVSPRDRVSSPPANK